MGVDLCVFDVLVVSIGNGFYIDVSNIDLVFLFVKDCLSGNGFEALSLGQALGGFSLEAAKAIDAVSALSVFGSTRLGEFDGNLVARISNVSKVVGCHPAIPSFLRCVIFDVAAVFDGHFWEERNGLSSSFRRRCFRCSRHWADSNRSRDNGSGAGCSRGTHYVLLLLFDIIGK